MIIYITNNEYACKHSQGKRADGNFVRPPLNTKRNMFAVLQEGKKKMKSCCLPPII